VKVSPAFSIVVPAFNEESGLARALERILAFIERCGEPAEVIVVDDGSGDRTPAIAAGAAARNPEIVRVIRHDPNRGLAAGIRSGAEAARAPIVVILDADLSYAPETIPPMLAALREGGAAIAMASPYMRGGQVSHVPLDRLIASRGANLILSACTFGRLKTFTGMVRAYRVEVLRDYAGRTRAGEFNSWLVAEALRDGYRILEVPAHLNWPPERYEAAPRIGTSKLITRALAVLRTARILLAVSVRGVSLRGR